MTEQDNWEDASDDSRRALIRFREQFARFRDHCFLVAPTATATRPEDNPDGIGTLSLDLAFLGSVAGHHPAPVNAESPSWPRGRNQAPALVSLFPTRLAVNSRS